MPNRQELRVSFRLLHYCVKDSVHSVLSIRGEFLFFSLSFISSDDFVAFGLSIVEILQLQGRDRLS